MLTINFDHDVRQSFIAALEELDRCWKEFDDAVDESIKLSKVDTSILDFAAFEDHVAAKQKLHHVAAPEWQDLVDLLAQHDVAVLVPYDDSAPRAETVRVVVVQDE